jgi:hypothetical protein
MYQLDNTQIDFISNDIRARGVEMESLQQDLLDHVCCIIEQNLEERGDFEHFYQKTIQTFYKDALWEIEEETISLLTFKNYYTMKKTMIISGAISAFGMTFGIFFKFMHWPGASVLILLGIFSASFLFLPLLFTLKAKEKQNTKDKVVLFIGALAASLVSLSILFKIQHWPYANMMGMSSIAIMLILFLPVYFFSGIRNPEARVNTIASSVVIILGAGLIFTLIRTPQTSRLAQVRDTFAYLRSEQILRAEQERVLKQQGFDSSAAETVLLSKKINALCSDIKSLILTYETGSANLDENFENKEIFLPENSSLKNPLEESPGMHEKLEALVAAVNAYNSRISNNENGFKAIPTKATILDYFVNKRPALVTIVGSLNQLTQIQMFVLQNQGMLLATK